MADILSYQGLFVGMKVTDLMHR